MRLGAAQLPSRPAWKRAAPDDRGSRLEWQNFEKVAGSKLAAALKDPSAAAVGSGGGPSKSRLRWTLCKQAGAFSESTFKDPAQPRA